MRRRLLFLLFGLAAGLLVMLATLPWWLGIAAKSIAPGRGLTFASYERVGYGRFALTQVEYQRERVRVTASRVEADSPVFFLMRLWRDRAQPIHVAEWQVHISPSTGPEKPSTSDRGWTPLNRLLQTIARHLDSWAPHVTVEAGFVRWPGAEIGAEKGIWKSRELTVGALRYRDLAADASLAFGRGVDALKLQARSLDGTMSLALESDGPQVKGSGAWLEQPAGIEARFGSTGWLPAEAALNAIEWTVPGDRLKLGAFYQRVRGSAQIEWRERKLLADVNVVSEPIPNKPAPPLTVDLRGQGDWTGFTIEALQIILPGIGARLSEPVTIERNGILRGEGARLALRADLGGQPWFAADGIVTGEATVTSGAAAAPRVTFAVQATDFKAFAMALTGAEADGTLEWPRLQISKGVIRGQEGESLDLSGGWDFAAKELLTTRVDGTIHRESLARWLPSQPMFGPVQLNMRAAGPLAALEHSGEIRAEAVKFAALNPLSMDLSWKGWGIGAETFDLKASTGGTVIVAGGAVDRAALRLRGLEFSQGGQSRFTLAEPVVVRWSPGLQWENLRLTGPQANLTASVTLGKSGKVEVSAGGLSSIWFTDLFTDSIPALQLRLLALAGTWDGGPMTFSLTAGASLDLAEGRTAAVNMAARGDKDGIRIETLRAIEGSDTVVNATGRLPVTVYPGSLALLHIDEMGPVLIEAMAAPNAAFWQKLAVLSGVELQEPQALAKVKGTWRLPEGQVTLKAARLSIDPKRIARPLPAIEQIDVSITGDRQGVKLDRFAINVEGQPVRATGRLPVPEDGWADVIKSPWSAATRGSDLQLDIPEAEVAVFARFLPAVLAPQGKFQATLAYKDGGINGFVRLREAASRPLGPLGILQEITADLELSGRRLMLRSVSALSGGQPVTLSGTVELLEKGEPRYNLALKGDNLPFVRQTGLLVRGDLDFKLQTVGAAAPRLSGTVKLRDSLFLSDLRSFLPRGGGGAARRPPYFSVDTPPVNAWTLAVEVTGDEFMRLRTPVFNGVASARFRLSGTLEEPRAIGEVEIDEGAVRMPFARFEVQQGSVRLTEADPYEPTLYLRGTGRRYGYDLTVELDGRASAPNVVFTSSPALDSEQVLLMVMTGAAPSNEIAVTGTQRMTRLGTFVGQNLLNSLTSDNADADRLSITAGEKISRQGRETYDIEYKVSDRWSVRGEYNEFDEYNAGLKWRVFRGEGRPRDGGNPDDHAGAGK